MRRQCKWLGLAAGATVISLVSAATLPAIDVPIRPLADLRIRAEEHEKNGQWDKAADLYNRILRRDHSQINEIRQALHRCQRRAQQTRRLRDKSFCKTVQDLKLKPSKLLEIYQDVLAKLQAQYVDRDKIDLATLFQQGVQELLTALEDDVFVRDYLTNTTEASLAEFKIRLLQWREERVVFGADTQKVRNRVCEVARAAQLLGIDPAIVVLEFTCGACSSLDEYTLYLTPQHYGDVKVSLSKRHVGIGVDLGVIDGTLLITRVLPSGPAYGLLKTNDRILSIEGTPVNHQVPSADASRLEGEEGTTVELEVRSAGSMIPRKVQIQRQAVDLRSVEAAYEMKEGSGVGYIKLTSFRDDAVQEVKDAIHQLQSQSMGLRALVLDLRENPGGIFDQAVKVARLFLAEGIIAFKQDRYQEWAYRAENPNAWTFPLILLVNEDTASAAEMVAGTLKENGRATLVGQTTYGKGLIQHVQELKTLRGTGLQITVARYYSPSHDYYHGRGVVPHHFIEANPMMGDSQRDAAFMLAQQILDELMMR